jgi:hypothetical protein
MPQQRIAPTGFGGGAGFRIISGIARGEAQAREEQRIVQQQAMQQRIQQQQQENVAQQMRLRQEEADFQEQERLRAAQTRQATGEALKKMYGADLPPGISEDAAAGTLEAIYAMKERESALETQGVQRQSAQANIQRRAREVELDRRADAVAEIVANPNFFNMATFDKVDPTTRLKAAQAMFPDADPDVIAMAIQVTEEQQAKVRTRQKQIATAKPPRADLQAQIAADLEEHFGGSKQAMLDSMRQDIELGLVPDPVEQEEYRQVIAELERQTGVEVDE